MDTTINDLRSPSLKQGNRNYQVFNPTSPSDLIKIHNDTDCFGTTKIKDIQIEVGNTPTFFVPPSQTEHEVTGLFQDLRAINIQMTDPNSDFWSRIKANNEAMLIEYGANDIQSAIGLSADTLRAEFQDSQNKQNSSWTQTLEGFESRVKDEVTESTVTQLSSLYDVKIADVNGNISNLTQTINGFRSRVETAEGKVSNLTQTVDGFNARVEDVEGNYTQMGVLVDGFKTTVNNEIKGIKSTQAQLDDRISQVITDVDGNYSSLDQRIDSLVSTISGTEGDFSELIQKIDAYGTRIGDVEGNQSSLTQRVDGIQTRVTNVEGNYSSVSQLVSGLQSEVYDYYGNSKITQLSNEIQSKVSSSQVESIINQQSDNIWLGIKSKVEDTASQYAGSSKMTGYEIKTAINLTNDGVYIQGKQVAINGETYIASGTIKTAHIGNAQITDAKIGSVSADKMTTGTLNAANVNVINLNASNITTGTFSADRISAGTISGYNAEWNLNTGQFSNGSLYGKRTTIANGVLTTYNGSQIDTRLNGKGLDIYHQGIVAGKIAANKWSSSNANNVQVAHYPNSSLTLSGYNESTGSFNPYISFDRNEVSNDLDFGKYSIRVYDPIRFLKEANFNDDVGFQRDVYLNLTQYRLNLGNGFSMRSQTLDDGAGARNNAILIGDGAGNGIGFTRYAVYQVSNGTTWRKIS